jgi:hypothetical protein
VDPEVEATRELHEYATDDLLSNGDPAGKNAEGSQVAHELLALEGQGLKELHGKTCE